MKFAPIRNSLFALLAGIAAFFLTPIPGHAATIWWNGQTDSMWTGFNWTTDGTDSHSGTSLPNGDLVFSSTSAAHQQSTMLGADFSIHSLTFMDPAVVRMSGPYTLTIADDGSIPGYITVDAGAGYVTIENDLALDAHLVTVEGNALLRINGDIHGNVLTKDGLGSLVLAGVLDSGMTLNVNAGTVYLIRGQTFAGLHIGPGATVLLAEHGPDEPNGTKVIDTSALTVDLNGGTLDLTNNAMVVRGGSLGALTALITHGFNGGLWNAAGITSSTAAADPNSVRAVGVIDNAELGLPAFHGVGGLTGNEMIVRFTFYGDADLNNVVDNDDYSMTDAGFGGGLSGWLLGDFNYDGGVDNTDYAFIDAGFAGQGFITPDTDSDWDGMPDWWEMEHALKWWHGGDASLDADGDGVTNLEEYVAGTGPNDPASRPYKVTSSTPDDGQPGHDTNGVVLLYLNKQIPAGVTTLPAGIVKRTTDGGTTWQAVTGMATVLPGQKCVAFVPSADFIPHAPGSSELTYRIDFTAGSTGLTPVVPLHILFSVEDPDPVGPWVKRVWPGEHFIEVATDFAPVVQWSEPLRPDTATDSTNVSLRPESGTSDLPVTLTFDYFTNRLTITPAAALQPDTVYNVALGTGFKNLMGLPLLNAYKWSFRTRPTPPPPGTGPHITASNPLTYAQNVATDTVIAIEFGEAMDGTTLSAATVHLRAYGTAEDVDATFNYDPATHRLLIGHAAPLSYSTAYALTFDGANILSSATIPEPLGEPLRFVFATQPDPNGGGDGGPGGPGGVKDPDKPKPVKINVTYAWYINTLENGAYAIAEITKPDGSKTTQTGDKLNPTKKSEVTFTIEAEDGSTIKITPKKTSASAALANATANNEATDTSNSDGANYTVFREDGGSSEWKYLGQLSGGSYTAAAAAASGPQKLIITPIKFDSTDYSRGFDPLTAPSWTSVCQVAPTAANETNLNLNDHIVVRFADDATALKHKVVLKEGDDTKVTLEVDGGMKQDTKLKITGKPGAGPDPAPATIYVYLEADTDDPPHPIATLNVDVLPKVTLSLGIWKVSDSDSRDTEFNFPGTRLTDIFETINRVFRQACIVFTPVFVNGELKDVHYDKHRDGKLSKFDETDSEIIRVKNAILGAATSGRPKANIGSSGNRVGKRALV